MKKKLFSKFFALVAMVLFTVTACQNEDVVNPNIEDDIAMESAILQLDEMNGAINDAFTAYINVAHEQFELLTNRLMADPENERLQKQVIAKGVQIEAITTYQTRAAGDYPTVPDPWSTSGGGMGSDVERRELHEKLNVIVTHLTALQTFIENNIGGGSVDLTGINNRLDLLESSVGALQTAVGTLQGNVGALQGDVDALQTAVTTLQGKVTTLEGKVTALENVIPTLATKAELAGEVEELEGKIAALRGELAPKIATIYSLLGIAGDPPASSVLDGINEHLEAIDIELLRLDDIKANKFTIEEKLYDLRDVYDELQDSLAVHRTEIEALKKRVTYIEEVEIPAIWEGISILYEYIGDVYDNLDQRVTGLTFKPDYDFGPGLSSLILVRGISEWEPKTVENGFGWQEKAAGSPYKGVTWLTYNVSPANANLDVESVELVYTTTKLITRSAGGEENPLLKIADANSYPMTFENGILRVPVLIHSDAYPLIQTSFDPDSKENIKVALRVKNSGITAPDEPTRPEKEEEPGERSGDGGGDETDRSVVSSEYVTVWLGLFEGYIAVSEEADPDTGEPALYPTEIVTADFRDKTNEEFPSVTLLVTSDNTTNEIDIAESVTALYFNQFEKKYKELLNEDFEKDYELTYELADLGNDHGDFVSLSGSMITVTNKQKSIGETVAVLVKAKVGDAVHAVGYVRVLIVGEDKEVIVIADKLSLTDVIINCSVPVEFTNKDAVQAFVSAKILGTTAVNEKTKITDAAVFYQKYTGIVIDEADVSNNNATLAPITGEELKSLLTFAYVPGEQYIKGTVSNEAPIGTYTVVTTLSSDERIPDIQITWEFTVKTPKLIWNNATATLVVNPTVPDLINIYSPKGTTADFGASISELFKKHASGGFEYADLNGQVCPGFVAPYFVFTNVPNGYTIAGDGKSVMKNSTTLALIEEVEGDFRISLIENEEAAGLVGSNEIKIAGKGVINDGTHTIYEAFNVVFTNPLIMVFPANAKFNSSNLYLLNFYKNNNSTPNVVRDYQRNELTVYNVLPSKIFIDHYGVDLNYDTSFSINTALPTQETIYSPYIFDVENAVFNQAVPGVQVIIEKFQTADTRSYYGKRTPIRYRFKIVNNSGNPLPSGLEVTIPAILKHRWGVTTENLVIRVN